MFDDSSPGAALEAPETFQVLATPIWPRLPIALGYTGGARWVAFYVHEGQARWADGAASSAADRQLFLVYRRHPQIASSLASAHLGSADEEARVWLVVDTLQQLCYLASPEEATRFLIRQWPRSEALPLEYTPEELARLLEETTSPSDWQARQAEGVRERQANERLMQQWLASLEDA